MTRLICNVMLVLAMAGCMPRGPVIDTTDKPPAVSGTISGMVRAAATKAPLSARRVTATDVASGKTFETSTAANGGYTMQVPIGRYRLDVELQPGEAVVEAPSPLEISSSDLDAGRDFTIAAKPSPRQ
jgi:hypothetical protein